MDYQYAPLRIDGQCEDNNLSPRVQPGRRPARAHPRAGFDLTPQRICAEQVLMPRGHCHGTHGLCQHHLPIHPTHTNGGGDGGPNVRDMRCGVRRTVLRRLAARHWGVTPRDSVNIDRCRREPLRLNPQGGGGDGGSGHGGER